MPPSEDDIRSCSRGRWRPSPATKGVNISGATSSILLAVARAVAASASRSGAMSGIPTSSNLLAFDSETDHLPVRDGSLVSNGAARSPCREGPGDCEGLEAWARGSGGRAAQCQMG